MRKTTVGKRLGGKSSIGGDYEVGFKKPPVSGRIVKGEVRNQYGRRGKPKPESDGSELDRILAEVVSFSEHGKTRKVTKGEGVTQRFVHEALKGEFGFAKYIMVERAAVKQAKAILEADLFEAASYYKAGWQAAYEQGYAESLSNLPVHPHDLVLDIILGEVRFRELDSDGKELERRPKGHVLLRILRATPPPALGDASDAPSPAALLNELRELTAKGRGEPSTVANESGAEEQGPSSE